MKTENKRKQTNEASLRNLSTKTVRYRHDVLSEKGIDEIPMGGFRLYRFSPEPSCDEVSACFPYVMFPSNSSNDKGNDKGHDKGNDKGNNDNDVNKEKDKSVILEAITRLKSFQNKEESITLFIQDGEKASKPYVCIIPSTFSFPVAIHEEYLKKRDVFNYRIVPYGFYSHAFPVIHSSKFPLWDVHEDAYRLLFLQMEYPTLYSLIMYARQHQNKSETYETEKDATEDYALLPLKRDDIDGFLKLLPYAGYVRFMTEYSVNKVSFFAKGNHCLYHVTYYPQFIRMMTQVRGEPPSIEVRVFPVEKGYRFSKDSFMSFIRFFADALHLCIPNVARDRKLFDVYLYMLDDFVPDDDVMESLGFSKTRNAKVYPMWCSPLCCISERSFSTYGFLMRQFLSMVFPRLHEEYMRHSMANDVTVGMMKRMGWVLGREIRHCRWCISIHRDVFDG